MPVNVYLNLKCARYTGSVASANDCVAAASHCYMAAPWSIESHVVDGTLVLANNTVNDITLQPGEYLVANANTALPEVLSSVDFDRTYISDTVSVGTASVPTLLTTQSATVAVTLKIPFFNTSYSAVAVVTGALNLLGALQINSVTIVDEDTVNVVVQNTGLLTLSGASVLVVATRI